MKRLPHRIWLDCESVDGFWQEIIYEKLLSYCKHCKKLGHDISACKIAHPYLIKKPPVKEKYAPKAATQYVKKTSSHVPREAAGKPSDPSTSEAQRKEYPSSTSPNQDKESSSTSDIQMETNNNPAPNKQSIPTPTYVEEAPTPNAEQKVPPLTQKSDDHPP